MSISQQAEILIQLLLSWRGTCVRPLRVVVPAMQLHGRTVEHHLAILNGPPSEAEALRDTGAEAGESHHVELGLFQGPNAGLGHFQGEIHRAQRGLKLYKERDLKL